MVGQPIFQIFCTNNETKKLELKLPLLRNILLKENIKDNEIAIISIAGAFRKGKSFILSYFLRYMNETISKNNSKNWLSDVNCNLDGFSWSGH